MIDWSILSGYKVYKTDLRPVPYACTRFMYAIQGLNGKSFWDRAGSHICGRKPEHEQIRKREGKSLKAPVMIIVRDFLSQVARKACQTCGSNENPFSKIREWFVMVRKGRGAEQGADAESICWLRRNTKKRKEQIYANGEYCPQWLIYVYTGWWKDCPSGKRRK